MFAARGVTAPVTGIAIFFEIDSIRPIDITFSFVPEMLRMWPAPNFGRPNGEWLADGQSGVYVLHTDNPKFSALVAMPRTRPGILVPYQEHPQTYPLELTLKYEPDRDRGLVFPLVLSMLDERSASDVSETVLAELPRLYRQTVDYYLHFFDRRLVRLDYHSGEFLAYRSLYLGNRVSPGIPIILLAAAFYGWARIHLHREGYVRMRRSIRLFDSDQPWPTQFWGLIRKIDDDI
jgi:hypothetical protein